MKKVEKLKMKKLIILVVIVGLIIFFICNITSKNSIETKSDVEISNKEIELLKEIKIYDIEEGYLKVPYNYNAEKNNFNFEKY